MVIQKRYSTHLMVEMLVKQQTWFVEIVVGVICETAESQNTRQILFSFMEQLLVVYVQGVNSMYSVHLLSDSSHHLGY